MAPFQLCISLIFLLCNAIVQATSPVLIDGIVAAVYGPVRTNIVTYSDLQRPGIDGGPRTVNLVIDRHLEDQKAQHYGMTSTPEAVDKQLQTVFRANNWSEEDFNKMVQAAGWLPEEAREEFRIMTDVNQLEAFKIYGQMIVPERDILAYYNANPEHEDGAYHLQRAVIPYDFTLEPEEQKTRLLIALKRHQCVLEWSDPFWINDQDIAEDKAFIRDLSLRQISKLHQSVDGFEVYKVLEKRERRQKSLEEMRPFIVDTLRQPKVKKLKEAFHKELRDNATIVYFDEDIAAQVHEQVPAE